jgi:hypothetical protein
MKKKFASYLLTGKAATLPFYAANSMAADSHLKEHIKAHPPCLIELPSDKVEVTSLNLCKKDNAEEIAARIAGCPGGKGPNAMTVVVVGLRAGDVVFIIASDDRDGYRDDWEPDFRLGKENTRFVGSFFIPPARELLDIEELIKEPLKAFRIGGSEVKSAGEAVSLPIDLAKLPNKDGFHLQAVVLREGEDGETKTLFSEMDRIERIVEGEECPVLPPIDIEEPPCEKDSYGECVIDGGPGDPGDPYGGGSTGSEGTPPGSGGEGSYGAGGGDTGTTPGGGGDAGTTPGGGGDSYGGSGGSGGSY